MEWPALAGQIETGDFIADVSRSRRELGWRPAVSLREGLERTAAFYRARVVRERGADRVVFLSHAFMVGGAEEMVLNLVRRLPPRFEPMVMCINQAGPIGEEIRKTGVPFTVLGLTPGLRRPFDVLGCAVPCATPGRTSCIRFC